MACPTCDHTMQVVFEDVIRTIAHCPRCGTMRSLLAGHTDNSVPSLVGRVRALKQLMTERARFGALDQQAWNRLGLFEAIYRPEDRPA